MKFPRGSGVLLHFTSLPGNHGIGDLGQSSRDFIDFLKDSGQRYWQFLPTTPCSGGFDYSPYTSLSAFAGNPLLISIDGLVDAGLLSAGDVAGGPVFSPYVVEFDAVAAYKEALFAKAFQVFSHDGFSAEFERFRQRESWLDDYAVFMALREEHGLVSWSAWPGPEKNRQAKAMEEARRRLADRISYHAFLQYIFAGQWQAMHGYAAAQGISLIGDIPIYVAYDSADVWCHPDCFALDRRSGQATKVAGVPPDYFSATGQRWGNPLYRWQLSGGGANEAVYQWWRQRFAAIFRVVDIVRIDHFRAFESYWEIPAAEETAMNGRWVKGPGLDFFQRMADNPADLPIIAEDLGIITPEVEALRDDLGFPGMKILQFAFDSDQDNLYLPHNYQTTNCVVYTGTHDNDTTVGWYLSDNASPAARARVRRYANCGDDAGRMHREFVRLALGSVADVAIIPMQDLLGFGSDCRMNTPSTTKDNWRWRLAPEFITEGLREYLRDETEFYGRAPRGAEMKSSRKKQRAPRGE